MFEIKLLDDWRIEINPVGQKSNHLSFSQFEIAPPILVSVQEEIYPTLPEFNSEAPGWLKGSGLYGVRTQETTAYGMLVPESLKVLAAPGIETEFSVEKDYLVDLSWGTIGRTPDGRIAENHPVAISYVYGSSRIDTLFLDKEKQISIRKGTPHIATPHPPELFPDEQALYNLWIPGRLPRLTPDHIFPITRDTPTYPEMQLRQEIQKRLPHTVNRLKKREKLRILAWGDSVTDGSFLPDLNQERWQNQFVNRLVERYPGLEVELISEAWGGHNTASYLAEPPGSTHNYREKVLAARPNLVVSEFVNDSGLPADWVEGHYSQFLHDFQSIGAEWIILSPHYVRPDWMGLDREIDIDEDPREYVHNLRIFAKKHLSGVALADASLRWGSLWRQGIPYTTLLMNAINHPDPRGMKIFADTLLDLL